MITTDTKQPLKTVNPLEVVLDGCKFGNHGSGPRYFLADVLMRGICLDVPGVAG